MKVNLNKLDILKYEKDMKDKFIGKIFNCFMSTDDMAWQWDITDEFERRFVIYSKENINSKMFLQHNVKVEDNIIHLFLYDAINDTIVLSVDIEYERRNNKLKIIELKVVQTNPDWRVEYVES
ncbi:hypothetical protein BFS06_12335 [Clostridium perfringens]|uniref:Uncharacterized protein n=1 Tax=Clostridium perfringens TaxID=1502 RepID=A0A140GR34_CLOPF|nr:hypothetical protein [Clostridium perfringens]AMN30993.1 hypothetical protein JFP838_pA0077 [Clostridium perfringens]TBX14989.1 hypothetical protein BFS06_12335 [Clostridium perfringens]